MKPCKKFIGEISLGKCSTAHRLNWGGGSHPQKVLATGLIKPGLLNLVYLNS